MPSRPSALSVDTHAPLYNRRWLLATVLSFVLIALWDAWGQDLAMAHLWGTAQGFALRDDHFLVTYMHQGMRNLGWVVVLALSLGVWLPFGLLRQLPTARRVQLLVSILASLAVVAILKRSSATSCPWDLSMFGGVADYVSHWRWGLHDGGAGHCFPAGHAAAGFPLWAATLRWRAMRHVPLAGGWPCPWPSVCCWALASRCAVPIT